MVFSHFTVFRKIYKNYNANNKKIVIDMSNKALLILLSEILTTLKTKYIQIARYFRDGNP